MSKPGRFDARKAEERLATLPFNNNVQIKHLKDRIHFLSENIDIAHPEIYALLVRNVINREEAARLNFLMLQNPSRTLQQHLFDIKEIESLANSIRNVAFDIQTGAY
jgi:hypothetical protein